MNELWKRITAELLSAGHPSTTEQVYAFVRLHRLADAVVQSGRSPECLAALRPTLCLDGGIILNRLSVAAREYIETVFDPWLLHRPTLHPVAMSFFMANSARPEVFAKLAASEAVFLNELVEFSKKIPLSDFELDAVVTAFVEVGDEIEAEIKLESEKGRKKSDLGWIIEQICHDYSVTPNDVLWVMSKEEVKMLSDNGIERRRREAAARVGKPVTMNPYGRQGLALRALYELRDELAAQMRPEEASP